MVVGVSQDVRRKSPPEHPYPIRFDMRPQAWYCPVKSSESALATSLVRVALQGIFQRHFGGTRGDRTRPRRPRSQLQHSDRSVTRPLQAVGWNCLLRWLRWACRCLVRTFVWYMSAVFVSL